MVKYDIYQKRYLDYQKRKKQMIDTGKLLKTKGKIVYNAKVFFDIMTNRRSQRIFNNEPVAKNQITILINSAYLAPSSCNRKGIIIEITNDKSIGELLKGGKGWANKADCFFLLFADMVAYKSRNEIDFMPYLDAGHISQNIQLTCEALSLGCCFVNPNISNKEEFNKKFNKKNLKFCGMIAVGNYDLKTSK